GTARVAETEEAGTLVERLARSVVERRPQDPEPRVVLDVEQQRVPAAREQAQERRVDRVGLEVQRGDVSLQMVDRNERDAPAPGEPLRDSEPDQQCADQPWPAGDTEPV